MSIELVVLDFDGTLTDIDKEALPFVDGYKNDISKDLGLSRDVLDKKWDFASGIVDSNLSGFVWKINDRIVAPAYANPFIYCVAVADILLDDANLFFDFDDRKTVLDKYFLSNYNKVGLSFMDDADDFLSSVKSDFDTCIVTSSDALKVKSKLEMLNNHFDVPVFGSAQKHVLDSDWDIPDFVNRVGYGRPLFLRRRKYWDVISSLLDEKNLNPENVVVVGDSYELDLLLPEFKGMNVIFMPNSKVPSFEVDAVKSYNKGFVASSLSDAFNYLKNA